jgi:[ribosomal protein S18]-alanine N-acetyltransferase
VCADLAKEEKPRRRVTTCRREDLAKVEGILQVSPEAACWSERSLAEAFEQHGSHFLICWQGQDIRGFISGRQALDEGEILNLAVHASWRRQGIGKALVQALLEVFQQEAVVQVFLEVRESNIAAIELYKGLGFRPMGKRKDYYRNPTEAALQLSLSRKRSLGTI